MELLTIRNASQISGVPERTIRDWMDDGSLEKFKNDDSKLCVERRELLMKIPTVITLFNQKGGCGKTSLSVLLGDYFTKKNFKILLLDFDQQGNLTQTYFSYDELKDSLNLYDYFEKRTPLSKIIKSYNENIDVLPADIKLSRKSDDYDIDELDTLAKDFMPIFKKYNMVLIDCPPALNSFSKFGLLLCNYVFIPVFPEPYNYDGLFEVLNTINRLKKYISGFIDYKVVISGHEQRTLRIQEEYLNLIRTELNEKVAEFTVPNFVGVKERGGIKTNLFDMYQNDKSMLRLQSLMNELDTFLFELRGIL